MQQIVLTYNEFCMLCEGIYATGFDSCIDGCSPQELCSVLESAIILPNVKEGTISVILTISDYIWPRFCNHVQWDNSDSEIATLLPEFAGCAKFMVSLRDKFKE